MTAAKTRTGSFTIGFRRGWTTWQKDTAALARWAAANRFGAIDLGADGAESADTVRQAGLSIGSADLLDWKSLLSPDESKRRDTVARNEQYIGQCAEREIRNFFACMLPEDPARLRPDNFADMVKSLGELAPTLEQFGGAVVIEGWPGPGVLCCTPADCRALFEQVPSPAMAINYDPSHLVRMGIDHIRFLHEFAPRVRHVHAKDTELFEDRIYDFGREQRPTFAPRVGFSGPSWRYAIPGHGQCRWPEIFRILKQAEYRGAVCIELEDANFNGAEASEKQGLIYARQFLESC